MNGIKFIYKRHRSSARSLNSTEDGSESLSLPCSESLTSGFNYAACKGS